MKIDVVNSIRVLTPSDGMWLYNESQKILSVDNRVLLGVEADEKEWTEITIEEKERIESLFESDDNKEV